MPYELHYKYCNRDSESEIRTSHVNYELWTAYVCLSTLANVFIFEYIIGGVNRQHNKNHEVEAFGS